MVRKRPGSGAALARFAVVAGSGWLLDTLLLVALAGPAGLPSALANILSSIAAASFVYLVSHRRVHYGRPGLPALELAIYILYTLALILAASLVLGLLVPLLQGALPGVGAVLAAKILVTPPQFLCNFFVSRALAQRSSGPRA